MFNIFKKDYFLLEFTDVKQFNLIIQTPNYILQKKFLKMHVKIVSVVIVLVTVLLLAQTVSIAEAHHKPKDKGEMRKAAEKKSEDYDPQGNLKKTIEEKRKAFVAYKASFKAWKTAKEVWKTAKISGDQTVIDAKKVILDAAIIVKDKALKEYLNAKKMKAR